MPAWLAFSVVRLLEDHFSRLVSYEFTARMEDVLDEIAAGRKDRNTELGEFYYGSDRVEGLHRLVTGLGEIDAKELATFPIGGPDSGIVLRVGRYGPYLEGPATTVRRRQARQRARRPAPRRADPGQGQGAVRQPGRRGDPARHPPRERPARSSPRTAGSAPTSPRCCPRTRPSRPGPRTGSLFKSMSLETVTLDDALKLLSLPRVVGTDADGVEITAQNGRYGPYLKKGTDSRSLAAEDQLLTITLDEALAIYAQPKQRGRAAATAPLKELGDDPVSRQPIVVQVGPLRRLRHRRRVQRHAAQGRHRRGRSPWNGPPSCWPSAGPRARRRRPPSGRPRRPPAKKATAKKATAKKATAKKATAKQAGAAQG